MNSRYEMCLLSECDRSRTIGSPFCGHHLMRLVELVGEETVNAYLEDKPPRTTLSERHQLLQRWIAKLRENAMATAGAQE